MSERNITIILSYNVSSSRIKANDNAADGLYLSFQEQFLAKLPEAKISHVCIQKTLKEDEKDDQSPKARRRMP